jgi:hypothetical protein
MYRDFSIKLEASDLDRSLKHLKATHRRYLKTQKPYLQTVLRVPVPVKGIIKKISLAFDERDLILINYIPDVKLLKRAS